MNELFRLLIFVFLICLPAAIGAEPDPFLAFDPYDGCSAINDIASCTSHPGCSWFDWWGGSKVPAVYVCRSRYMCRDFREVDCGKISSCSWDGASQSCYFRPVCASFRGDEDGCNAHRGECFYFGGECNEHRYCTWMGCENGVRNLVNQAYSDCCDCNDNWFGEACSYCPGTYHTDCKTCLTSNPNCTACSNSENCNNHATTVTQGTVVAPGCTCTCENHWELPNCATCPPQYNETNNCKGCSSDYITVYRECDRKCDIDVHCSGKADSVTADDSHVSCVCNCKIGYAGNDCSQCDAANGYVLDINLSSCRQCNNTLDCNGNAAGIVTVSSGVCQCGTCTHYWTGDSCDSCPVQYDPLTCSDCDSLRYARIGGNCELCTIETHCNNRSQLAFPNRAGDGCECLACESPFTGPTCSSCDQGKFSADCLSCRPGFINYPTCSPCSSLSHCNGRSTNITTQPPSDVCICDCDGQWQSNDCSVCPSNFNQTTCDKCVSGVNGTHGYPQCDVCTVSLNCNNRASSVSSINDKCVCECTDQWTGDNCDICPDAFDAIGCNSCASGRAGYPNCVMCDVNNCGNGASAVHVNKATDSCECECSGSWSGALCDRCASKYDISDCSSCADPAMAYPSCGDCTVSIDCNDRASKVTTKDSQCVCECNNNWSGSKCQTCPEPYGGVNCDTCSQTAVMDINGRGCRFCDVKTDCSDHASAAYSSGGSATTCSCKCSDQWSGPDCSQCSDIYAQDSCDKCAPGRFNYPECTVCADHCGANSKSFSVSNDNCHCECSDQWHGAQCLLCPSKYEQGSCDSCYDPSLNYPSCGSSMCSSLNCSANTVRVQQKEGVCACVCSNAWEGETCEKCPEGFNVGDDCGSCSSGYFGYPNCAACSMSGQECNPEGSIATQITSDSCSCKCKNGFDGDKCDRCLYDVAGASFPDCEPSPCNCQIDSDEPIWGRPTDEGNCSCSAAAVTESTITVVLGETLPQYYINNKHPAVDILTNTLSGISLLTFSPTMVITASRLRGATDVCRVPQGYSNRAVSPIFIDLGPGADSANLGSLLGTFIIVLLLYLVHVLVLLMRVHYHEQKGTLPTPNNFREEGDFSFFEGTPSFDKNAAFLQRPLVSSMCASSRFPNISIFIMIFVFQGVCTACMKLVIAGASPSSKALGVLSGIVFIVGFIFLVTMKVRRNVPRSRYMKIKGIPAVEYMFGEGEWVSVTCYNSVAKWGVVFEGYRPKMCLYLVAELLISLIMSVIAAIENVSMSVCKDLSAALTVIFALTTALVLYSKSYASQFDCHSTAIITLLTTCALGILTFGYSGDSVSNYHLQAADTILIITACLAILKCFVDMLLLFYVERYRRKLVSQIHTKYIEKGGRMADTASEEVAWNDDYEMILQQLYQNGMSNPHDAITLPEEDHSPSPMTNPVCPSEDSLRLSVSTVSDLLPAASTSFLTSSIAVYNSGPSCLIPPLDLDAIRTPLSNDSTPPPLSYRSLKAYNVPSQSPLAPLSQRMLDNTGDDVLL